ncbi:ROK family protein [Deinococcus fonticola]|uniref:ROK family protein n=1 Tax=Deinococcus fonticola TaxID=2528713 RepID=UPI001075719A|nr:ROK family protein [Deinococcus fonticola]
MSRVLALDIGGTSIRAALVEGQQVMERRECATPQPAFPDAVLDAASALARPLRGGADALGIACAGAVAGGLVTPLATHIFPNWLEVPVAQRLGEALELPATVLNDARAAAWGEFRAGAGQGTQEFMFVTVSTGVGAGLVLGGRLHLAANGLDAELGFTSVPAHSHGGFPVPGLGHLTALEHEASGTALGRQAVHLGLAGARALADLAEHWAEQGNEHGGEREAGEARDVYNHAAALLAWKISDVAALLGVTRVALGGSVGLRPGYLARVQRALAAFPARSQPQVVHAQLGADAGLVGAAYWAAG